MSAADWEPLLLQTKTTFLRIINTSNKPQKHESNGAQTSTITTQTMK